MASTPVNLTTQFLPGRLNSALLEDRRRMMTASPHRQEIQEEIQQVIDQVGMFCLEIQGLPYNLFVEFLFSPLF